jgi:hypothetical protein
MVAYFVVRRQGHAGRKANGRDKPGHCKSYQS